MLDFTVKRTILEQNLAQLYFKYSVRGDSWYIQGVLKEKSKYGLEESKACRKGMYIFFISY